MRKLFYIPAIIMALCLGCGSDEEKDTPPSTTTTVTITLGGLPSGKLSAQAIPSTISEIQITVTAIDMETVTRNIAVSGRPSITDSFDVLNGAHRKFDVTAKDHSGNVLYKGSETKDLDGSLITLKITLYGNSPPVADAGPYQTVTTNSPVTLNGSGSSDADGDTLYYFWSVISAPGLVTFTNTTTVNTSFTPFIGGDYTINLTVDDGWGGSSSDSVMITSTP
jgi:hypothetical protein